MGFFTEGYAKLLTDFDAAFGKQRDVIGGTFDAANREADANQAIAATRGGYSGSGLESTLFARNKALFAGQKATALNTLAANQESQRAQLNKEAMQGQLQDNTATQGMWGNLLSGAGSVIGTALKIFGGPPGIVAGAGVDAAVNADETPMSYGGSGSATSNYKI